MAKKKTGNQAGIKAEKELAKELTAAGYKFTHGKKIPYPRPNGRGFHPDVVIYLPNGDVIVIELKSQNSDGTVEEKVLLDVLSLISLKKTGAYVRTYMVLKGPNRTPGVCEGWTYKVYYLSPDFERDFPHEPFVKVIDYDDFVTRLRNHQL